MNTKGIGAKLTIRNIAITLVIAAAYYYAKLPALNLQNKAFYSFIFIVVAVYCVLTALSMGGLRSMNDPREVWRGLKKVCAVPLIICGALIAFEIVGAVISSPLIRAGAYTRLINIEDGDFVKDVTEVTFNQIPMLDKDSAIRLGDKKLGELADMVSQFEVAGNYTQINYKGRPVRVTPLRYGDLIKWLNNRSGGLPAYIVIDMVTQNVDVVRLNEGMKYTDAEHFGRYIYRYLRFNYPTYMFAEAAFEIDENGTPYWVCPKLEKKIGLFGGTDINGAVLVNAVTGEHRYYAKDEVPEWVDRVYTSDLIMEQYNYHGKYVNGFINSLFGQKGVTQTSSGYNYLVIDNAVYSYTGITSVGSDESNVGFILTNQRTKETKFYSVAGASEDSAQHSAEGVVQDLRYSSTFPLLLNISSQPTYFMALKDSAGLVKSYAMVNVRQYQIVATGPTIEACQKAYVGQLLEQGLIKGETVVTNTEEGKIADIRTAVLNGTSFYYLRLENKSYYYVVSAAEFETTVILNVGDRVSVQYADDSGSLRKVFGITKK